MVNLSILTCDTSGFHLDERDINSTERRDFGKIRVVCTVVFFLFVYFCGCHAIFV